MKLYWCRLAPWQQNAQAARDFCRRAEIDVSALWDDGDLAAHAAGRYLLAHAWSAAFPGRPMPPVVFTGEGKPVFSGDAPFHWNISHAGGLAVCAAAAFPLGVDVEEITPVDDDLLARLHPAERLWCRARSDGFFTLWTAKESLVKSRGEGLSALLALPPLVREDALCFETDGRFWQPVSIAPGYAAAVAAAQPFSAPVPEEAALPVRDAAGSAAAERDCAAAPARRPREA